MLILGFSVTSWLVALLVCVVAVWYMRIRKKLNYFKERGIPHPEPIPIFGNLWGAWKQPAAEKEMELSRTYGKVYGIFEGHEPTISIADPEILRNVLVKDFDRFTDRRVFKGVLGEEIGDNFLSVAQGETWKGIRQLVSPAFSTGKLKKMVEMMQECGENLVKHFKRKYEADGYLIVKDLYGGYTLDVIATCAFGTKLDSLGKEDDPFVHHAKQLFGNESVESPFLILIFVVPKFLMKLMGKYAFKGFEKTLNFFKKVVDSIIEGRNGLPSERGDFLDILLEEKRKAMEEKEEEKSLKQKVANNLVITAQAVLFFLAGFDTTASLMTWVSYHLAKHPDIQQKVYEEIEEKLKKHGGFTYDMICDVPYLDMVINETFRMTSPAIRLERVCSKEVEYNGLKIETDMVVKIPVHCIHHDEENYPEPEKFIPERFSPEEKANRDPYLFLPFGAGPRNCVGMRFALEEAKVALIHVLHSMKFVTLPETKVQLLKGLLFNVPKQLKLGVEFRE